MSQFFLDMEGLTNLVSHIKTIANSKADSSHSHDNYATKDELATAGKVKTVNDAEPDENGNIEIDTDDGTISIDSIAELFEGQIEYDEDDRDILTWDDGSVTYIIPATKATLFKNKIELDY